MTGEVAFTYTPPGPVLRQFLRSRAFVRGVMGPFASGKSTAAVMDILRTSKEQAPAADGVRYTRHAVIRNTQPELKTTTIKTWQQWVPQTMGRWVEEGPPRHHIRAEGIDMEVLFVALDRPDDVKKVLGMELTTAWVNEAREVPKGLIDALTGRVGRYPGANLGGCTFSGILMDTNPPDSDHWWYRLAEEQRPSDWEFFKQPSGLAPDAENLMWLNQNPQSLLLPADHPDRIARGRQYYERLCSGKSTDWIRVYVDGEYGFVQEGKAIYPEYVDSIHCANQPLLPLPGAVTVGCDWGLTPAATFAQRQASGQIIVFHELVSERMGAVAFAELLAPELAKYPNCNFDIVGDPSGDQAAQTDEQTVFQILRAKGLQVRPARSNDFTLRRDAVGAALSRLIDGKPGVLISPTCRKLRKAMAGGYCFKRLRVDGERYRDKPDKNMHSHVAESLQYAFLELGENPRAIRTGAHQQMTGTVIPKAAPWRVFG